MGVIDSRDVDAFRRAIADAKPGDHLPSLIFADWLDERGHADEAAGLRLRATKSAWVTVWRDGFAKVLPSPHLEALAKGLEEDDPKLLQGATTCPPPMQCVLDWPPDGADPITYGHWKADEVATVGQLEEFFAHACFDADQHLREPAACRYFLNWWDDSPRDEARRDLLALVRAELSLRAAQPEAAHA